MNCSNDHEAALGVMTRTSIRRNVQFYLADQDETREIRYADPDRDWRLFKTGTATWTGQTYLRLLANGDPVALCATPPTSGVVVTHADHLHSLLAAQPRFPNVDIICARADRDPQYYADFEIIQNGHSADQRRCHFVPHWPQPGLIPRNQDRGETISTLAFKGNASEINDAFRAPYWYDCLRQHNVNWQIDASEWHRGGVLSQPTEWNDYSQIDVIIAIRRDVRNLYFSKPASKLVNAWIAGVPAILGPEFAYRELRRSNLDYIEASTIEEATQAVANLMKNPALYRSMIANGFERAADFSATKVLSVWRDVLFSRIEWQCRGHIGALRRRTPIGLKYRMRKFAQLVATRKMGRTRHGS